MKPRASLPGASELFRPTSGMPDVESPAAPESAPARADAAVEVPAVPTPTGRVKHDQKITVYFSSEELYALEDAVLDLRRRHGLTLDRGRLVRTAVALAVADLAANGEQSAVVGQLSQP